MKTKKILSILLLPIIALAIYLAWYIHSASEHIAPHFHANFAMYVNGEKIDFSGDKYMEDVAGCSVTGNIMPEDRAHLHENNGDTIHVHADWVAWGHFFANNNFAFWDNYLALDTGDIYANWEWKTVQYVLNEMVIENPFNKLIRSKDQLLIVYGDEDLEWLQALYNTVSNSAHEYNQTYDPWSCSWGSSNGILSTLTEFVHSFYKMEH